MKKIVVSVPSQELLLFEDAELAKRYPVSTSKFGLGTEEGSNRTPLGTFRVCEKYGGKAKPGTLFKGRKPIGTVEELEEFPEDCVTSRILRLEDSDSPNHNTYQRYIYLHGTNQESLIGQPASHGCIRLANEAIIELYPSVPVGTPVLISNEHTHEFKDYLF